MTRPSFDEYLMGIAHQVAARSTCDRARVGCVLVQDTYIIATGYNGAPAEMPHCDEVGHWMQAGACVTARTRRGVGGAECGTGD